MDALPVETHVLDGEPAVAVMRGGTVESMHRVAACAVDAQGRVLCSFGTIDVPVFMRSTAKPFIAAAIVREGAVERFGLEPHEIAIVAASHNGEPLHVAAVRSILTKIGLTEAALRCGPHPPYDPASARALADANVPFGAIHNNCSGKHAGILALCTLLGADLTTYLEPAHPAQRLILDYCARACGQRVEELPLGVDGCGIPVFATSLRHAALAFSKLGAPACEDERDARALRVVRDAMRAYPQYVAGTGELDTELIAATGGRLVSKCGAEGVQGVAAGDGTGVAIKVIDGASRAMGPASLRLLHDLGLIDASVLERLEPLARVPLYNRAGRLVGAVCASDSRHAMKRST